MNNEELSRDFLSFALSRMLEDLDIACADTAESENAKDRLRERISLLQNYLLMLNGSDNTQMPTKNTPTPDIENFSNNEFFSNDGNTLNNENTINSENTAPAENAPTENTPAEEKTFTLSELAQFDGSGGKPAYVAYRGVVYDVTNNPRWAMGRHFGMLAGRDLTIEYDGCHAGRPTLEHLPIVGRLIAG